jgi:DNA processing protein
LTKRAGAACSSASDRCSSACDPCVRRSTLLGLLAPFLERSLGERRRLPAVLALSNDELIDEVARSRASALRQELERGDAAAVREAAVRAGLFAVCRHARSFPGCLREGDDAPAALWGRGPLESLERLSKCDAVAIVGSRRASPYGIEVAFGLARELALAGVPVVSGMARGADSAAHEGALAGGGLTVAVLGGGADVVYPASSRALYRRVVREGLVLSEMPPGFKPFRWSFPARNRIMAGLAAMTIVVEGTSGSGSLITAGLASDLGRDIGAVPGQVTSELAAGPNDLLADGAVVVRSSTDVLDALYGAGAPHSQPRPEPALDSRLRRVLEAVERGGSAIDELASVPEAVASVMAALTELELLGLVARAPGGRYVRRPAPMLRGR